MKKIIGFLFLSIFGLEASVPAQPKVLLADIGGVIAQYSLYKYAGHLGFSNLISYLARFNNPGKLGTLIFRVIEKASIEKDPTLIPTCTTKGEPLPYLLNAYQSGRVTDKQALKLALEAVDTFEQNERPSFSSDLEKEMVKKALTIIFTPEIHTSTMITLKPGVDLLKDIVAQENADGTRKIRIIGVSNWDKQSFALVKDAFPEVFALFDKIYISGECGLLKPDPRAFTTVLEQNNLRPEDVAFIDDQKENIIAAKAIGIENSILYTKDIYTVREKLFELGMLPEKPLKDIPWKNITFGGLILILGYLLVASQGTPV